MRITVTGLIELQMALFANAYLGRKVLVTGHTGFKGAWLSEWLLEEGAQVFGVSLAPEPGASLFKQLRLEHRIGHRVLDIRELGLLRDVVAAIEPDFVFHLAAQPLVRRSYDVPAETFAVNAMGTVNVLEAIRLMGRRCHVICITTDKCYENREWLHSYRECDPLGGHDLYSASKGAAEIAIAAYRRSFFSGRTGLVRLASARAGNVIGGGDWSLDRIVPDCVGSLSRGEPIPVRNRDATRPWQHVLEPLSGYLWLGACLQQESLAARPSEVASAFNFGPSLASNRSVAVLVEEILQHWPGRWIDCSVSDALHEAQLLSLAIDRAHHVLGWSPVWDFRTTVQHTVEWYRRVLSGEDALMLTKSQILNYVDAAKAAGSAWALPVIER